MATLEGPAPPVATIRRVTLRPVNGRDAELLRRWRREWSVRRFQPLHDLTLSQLRSALEAQQIDDLYRGEGEKYQWVVLADGLPAGWLTLVVNNWEHGLAEVGYALTTAYQRQGLMPRALKLLLEDLFRRTSLYRIEARCVVGNEASQRVLERCGFRHEGRLRAYFTLHGDRVDNHLYAILKDDVLRR